MEAPEKIYLSDFTDTTESVFYVKQDNTKKTDIEYTRTDVLIKKAAKWLNNFYNEDTHSYLINEDIKKFINYVKGE